MSCRYRTGFTYRPSRLKPRASEKMGGLITNKKKKKIFLNALVLYFYLEHVQRITFCRCFLIFNQAVFCVDDGVVLRLKIKNPTTTTTNNEDLFFSSLILSVKNRALEDV